MKFIEFRERLRRDAPEHVFDLWFEREEEIWDKYKLNEWQQVAYNDTLKDAFLNEIPLITFPNEIKKRLKIKDENIAKSIALDTAIHVFSRAKDYFKNTDNLIKSLGGEEKYWENYSPNYWNEIRVAEPLITENDMKKAYEDAKKQVSKAEVVIKDLEKSNVKDIIPKAYTQIISNFNEAKAKLNSENYDLIIGMVEFIEKAVIDQASEAKNKALNMQKVIPRKIEIEKELERREASFIRKRAHAKMVIASHFIGVLCLILAIFNLNWVFYLIFALISGNTRQYVDGDEENDDSFSYKIIGFIFGFVLAPTYILKFFEDLKVLKNIKNRPGLLQTDDVIDLREELARINRELE